MVIWHMTKHLWDTLDGSYTVSEICHATNKLLGPLKIPSHDGPIISPAAILKNPMEQDYVSILWRGAQMILEMKSPH